MIMQKNRENNGMEKICLRNPLPVLGQDKISWCYVISIGISNKVLWQW